MPVVQTPSVQSLPLLHFFVAVQRVGQLPPQSTSVSSPFCTWSEQPGSTQVPFVQTPWSQSPWLRQDCPAWQSGQTLPPQSTSLSSPFRTRSRQLGCAASISDPPSIELSLPASVSRRPTEEYSGKPQATARASANAAAPKKRAASPVTLCVQARSRPAQSAARPQRRNDPRDHMRSALTQPVDALSIALHSLERSTCFGT
jgi:hypothetical protein